MKSVALPDHLQKIIVGEALPSSEAEVRADGWRSYNIPLSAEVDPDFVGTCAREIGQHHFIDNPNLSKLFTWELHASDEDLTYVMLKYF